MAILPHTPAKLSGFGCFTLSTLLSFSLFPGRVSEKISRKEFGKVHKDKVFRGQSSALACLPLQTVSMWDSGSLAGLSVLQQGSFQEVNSWRPFS